MYRNNKKTSVMLGNIKIALGAICCAVLVGYCVEHLPADEKLYSYNINGEYWKSKASYEKFVRLRDKEEEYFKLGEELFNDGFTEDAEKMFDLKERFRLEKAKVEQEFKLQK